MRSFGYYKSLPIEDDDFLQEVELPRPVAGERDLLVEIKAIALNPVDAKLRIRAEPEAGSAKILGFDAAGVVVEAGSEVTLFRPGDEVFYAGDFTRPGTNSEYHLVDERLVGNKPKSLPFADSAAIPLTSITAWELLFERFGVARSKSAVGVLLVVGTAGGVGSILMQFARQLTGLRAGEFHALRWRHIDFDKRKLAVETRVDAYRTEDVPKTAAGMRKVPLKY